MTGGYNVVNGFNAGRGLNGTQNTHYMDICTSGDARAGNYNTFRCIFWKHTLVLEVIIRVWVIMQTLQPPPQVMKLLLETIV